MTPRSTAPEPRRLLRSRLKPLALMLPALAATLAGCVTIAVPHLVPRQLQPEVDMVLLRTVPARGVQIYECQARNGAAPAWNFVAPEAVLYDLQGRRIGHHDAGPRWSADDGSVVRGSVKQRADAPQPGDIPWLLLEARAEGRRGSFTLVARIQRINTRGGIAPDSGCDSSTLGSYARVSYAADYQFFGKP